MTAARPGGDGVLGVAIDRIDVSVYTIPTDQPESDGTLEWDATTLVLVEAGAGGRTGLGYTYGPPAAADVVRSKLAGAVIGRDALDVGGAWAHMVHEVRNLGHPGVGAMAISAVDIALWDLKARLLDLPLAVALDAVHERVPVYGSGGFTSYGLDDLTAQLAGWAEAGIPRVKIKIGREPGEDPARLRASRKAIGDDVALFVDANGAFTRKEALGWADRYADFDVRWYEEPVSSDDLEGLRLLRDRGPGGMEIAAGEYGYTLPYFRHMLDAGAVDCLQADVTRCGGITAFRRVGALCAARCMDLSAHCAPLATAHVAASVWHFRHVEYFHDHVRIESMLFDGVLAPGNGGYLRPDRSRPGLGVEFKRADAQRYRIR
ncbi:MAG: enolase C-terminal domain-like protein [Streptosporangiaceae bacterium]